MSALAATMAELPLRERQLTYLNLTPKEVYTLMWDWNFWARPNQLEPEGDKWSVWLALAGRGFGKTRLGSEWVRALHCGPTPLSPGRARHTALVAETAADARDVMVKGVSGILAVHPPEFRPVYHSSTRLLEWPNGSIAHTYSAEDPEQLRGPEHDHAWSDELAKWRYAEETWDMLQFGLRAGDNPRQLVTTTPKPIPIVRDLIAGEKTGETVVTRGSTYDNSEHLAPKFIEKMRDRYEGTRLGRQELRAEILDDVQGALWSRHMLDRRTRENPTGAGMTAEEMLNLPTMRRVVVAVDPSGSSGESQSASDRRKSDKSDEAANDIGIVAVGLGIDGQLYVLEDGTVNWGPADWARRVVQLYDAHFADMVVAENNFGGAMVEHTIRTERRTIPYRAVNASRGKVVRAQPVAALYEQGRVLHASAKLGKLEDQMINMTQQGFEGRGSPDRVDALVWAITDLVFGRSNRGGSTSVIGLG